MAGETGNHESLDRLRVIEDVSRTTATSVLGQAIRLGRVDQQNETERVDARRHARMGARVMLDSLVAVGIEIPTELLASSRFQTEIIPSVARNDSIRPSSDQIDETVDRIMAEEAEDEAAATR